MRRRSVWCVALLVAFLALGGACLAAEYMGTRISIAPLVVNGALVPDQVTDARVVGLTGAVSSEVGAKSLYWRNNRGGSGRPILYVGTFGEIELNGKWRIPRIPLKIGRNEIKVTVVPLKGKPVTELTVIHRTN